MPSRVSIAAIILFWLGMTAWLIENEVVPLMLAEDSPTYQVNLTDEIGSPLVNWVILSDGKRAGVATSSILAHDDQTYEFRSTLNFDKGLILFELFKNKIVLRRLENMYRVTDKGKLEALAMKVSVNEATGLPHPKGGPLAFGPPDRVFDVVGEAVDGEMPMKLLIDGVENNQFPLGKLDVSKRGNIVNPMHPVSRLRGLRPGQTWKITLVNPLAGAAAPIASAAIPVLIAEVKSDALMWNGRLTTCNKIECYPPGKKDEVVARTWVRRIDGLVLQQQASSFGFDLTLQRVPE